MEGKICFLPNSEVTETSCGVRIGRHGHDTHLGGYFLLRYTLDWVGPTFLFWYMYIYVCVEMYVSQGVALVPRYFASRYMLGYRFRPTAFNQVLHVYFICLGSHLDPQLLTKYYI